MFAGVRHYKYKYTFAGTVFPTMSLQQQIKQQKAKKKKYEKVSKENSIERSNGFPVQ